jgi:dihydroorotate dehydrogenase electron transfer subunit
MPVGHQRCGAEMTMGQFDGTVTSNVSMFPGDAANLERRFSDIRLMWLHAPQIAQAARPGQFVMVKCDDLTLARPISIHQVDGENVALFFSVLADGKGTAWLSQRVAGQRVQLLGPLGNGFTVDSNSRRLVLIGGGMGIAPLYFLAQTTVSQGKTVTLLMGAKTISLLYPQRLLPADVSVSVATEDGSAGHHGLITEIIERHASMADQVFACGPSPMYRQMAMNSRKYGLDMPVQVSLEANMACGHGVCYSCTLKTRQGLKQVCKDGPVFHLHELIV